MSGQNAGCRAMTPGWFGVSRYPAKRYRQSRIISRTFARSFPVCCGFIHGAVALGKS